MGCVWGFGSENGPLLKKEKVCSHEARYWVSKFWFIQPQNVRQTICCSYKWSHSVGMHTPTCTHQTFIDRQTDRQTHTMSQQSLSTEEKGSCRTMRLWLRALSSSLAFSFSFIFPSANSNTDYKWIVRRKQSMKLVWVSVCVSSSTMGSSRASLWHNAASVERYWEQKANLKIQEQAARIIKKNIQMMPLKTYGDSIKPWKENV